MEIIGTNAENLKAFYSFLKNVDKMTDAEIAEIDSKRETWQAEYSFWMENREAMENGELPN